jgi:hypothetical protein
MQQATSGFTPRQSFCPTGIFLPAFTEQGSLHALFAFASRWCGDPHPEEDGVCLLDTTPCAISPYFAHPRTLSRPCQQSLVEFFLSRNSS